MECVDHLILSPSGMGPPLHLLCKSAYLTLRRAQLAGAEGQPAQRFALLRTFVGLVSHTIPACVHPPRLVPCSPLASPVYAIWIQLPHYSTQRP